jgi:hypothetical protein
MEKVTTEPTQDSELKAVVNAIAGGDNVAAQASFDQIMQSRTQAALELKKTELAGNIFAQKQEEVPEEE